MCPPQDKIKLQNAFDSYPAKFLGFEVKPNYEIVNDKTLVKDQVNRFQMTRSHRNSIADLDIIGSRPVV